jgi:hypothetical protein
MVFYAMRIAQGIMLFSDLAPVQVTHKQALGPRWLNAPFQLDHMGLADRTLVPARF